MEAQGGDKSVIYNPDLFKKAPYKKDIKAEKNAQDTERVLDVDGVFIAVGIIPHTELAKELLECDEKGYVIAGEDCATSMPGVFVAGDARKKQP